MRIRGCFAGGLLLSSIYSCTEEFSILTPATTRILSCEGGCGDSDDYSALHRSRDLYLAEGSVPEMFSGLMSWVSRNISEEITYREDGHRFIVATPGGLRGITTDQLGQQDTRRPVNEHVYRLCMKYRFPDGARLIEGEGGGIRWVRKTLVDADLIPPKFYDKGVSFTAVITEDSLIKKEDLDWLDSISGVDSLTREQCSVLLAMRSGESFSNADVCKKLKIDSVDARLILQDLVVRGLVSVDGRGRSTIYFLASSQTHVRSRGDMSSTEEIVMAHLKEIGKASVSELRDTLSLTERQVRYTLSKLEKENLAEHDGGRPALWRLK